MDKTNPELIEKIRQQFDTGPYPRIPLEQLPEADPNFLHIHTLVTAYYKRNQRYIETEGKVILDAGCGSGYKSLALAKANPGATIVGIDFSSESVKLAQQRLQYHNIANAEFYTLPIEELPQLGKEFDYINCDEVLYLLPDPALGLQAMKAVLKPQGIIRTNLHSSLQRIFYYRAQEVFKMMGFMDGNPQDLEIELLREMMRALKNNVQLKSITWQPEFEENEQSILANLLLQGDKGYTILEMFSILEAAGLEFISMVNWRQWQLMDLFKEPDNLPVFLGISLPEISLQDQLHLFELLNPVHRLLDWWCGHPNQAQAFMPVEEWTSHDWHNAKAYLHPQLKTSAMQEELVQCIKRLQPFEISKFLPITGQQSLIDSTIGACLLPPLLEAAQPVGSLVKRWQKLRSLHPLSLEPTSEREAWEIITPVLSGLEKLGYVLLERQ